MRTVYYDRNGKEVSKDTYENLRKSKRGDTIEVVETGDDWSPWSVPYQFSGQRFLSPSPRQFVQLRLNLSSNRPEVAPTLRAVSLDYADAILAGATGEIDPRQAVPDDVGKIHNLPAVGAGIRSAGLNDFNKPIVIKIDELNGPPDCGEVFSQPSPTAI